MTINDLQQQKTELDEMILAVKKAQNRLRPKLTDRTYYSFVGDITFAQQDTAPQNIVFTVPHGVDFFAERLDIFPFFRFVTTDSATFGANEVSFRPCIFTSYEGAFNDEIQWDPAAVDAFITLHESVPQKGNRDYQNLPMPVQMLYSGAVNYRSGGFLSQPPAPPLEPYYSCFQFPGGMKFDVPWELPGGSTFTIHISPGFAGIRSDPGLGGDLREQNEYQLKAVLEGWKRIKS